MNFLRDYILNFFCSGMKSGEEVFGMMKTAQMSVTEEAKFALLRGLMKNGDLADLRVALKKWPLQLDEQNFLTAIEDLCLNDRHSWLEELLNTAQLETFSPHFAKQVQTLCIQLINCRKHYAAFYAYKTLVKPSSEVGYAKDLIKQMVTAKSVSRPN